MKWQYDQSGYTNIVIEMKIVCDSMLILFELKLEKETEIERS